MQQNTLPYGRRADQPLIGGKDLKVPTYTVRKLDDPDKNEWDINCSYEELQQICDEYGLEKVLKPVGFISQSQSTMRKAGGEWNDFIKKVDKKAGMKSKVNT